MRLLVGIATAGRRETLNETLLELARQSRLPEHVMLCAPVAADIDAEALTSLPFPTTVICGERGGSVQRNAILRRAADFDAVIFFDDDFFPSPPTSPTPRRCCCATRRSCWQRGICSKTGIHGPGLTPDYARQKLASAVVAPFDQCPMIDYYGVYGCNMLVRLAPVREHALFFDEALPLYSWQEDIDFSRQLAPYGAIVRSDALTGVHLGAKRSRVSGVRFGYSQVANPIYLIRKGTMSLRFGMRTMVRNLLANAVRQFRSEPHIDRAGRCKGNILALTDLLRGRLRPQRILELD